MSPHHRKNTPAIGIITPQDPTWLHTLIVVGVIVTLSAVGIIYTNLAKEESFRNDFKVSCISSGGSPYEEDGKLFCRGDEPGQSTSD